MEPFRSRAVIHFLWKKGRSNKEITSEIDAVYGDDAPSLRTVQKWTKLFNEGKEDLDDAPRSGRPPKEFLVTKVRTLLEENPFFSQKKIAKTLEVDQRTIHHILSENLGLTRVNFRWIPYSLNDTQKESRVTISKTMLRTLSRAPSGNIITGDETWVYLRNPRSSMWIDSSIPRPEKPKLTIGSKKVMITVFWSPKGMRMICLLPPGHRFTKQYFLDDVVIPLEKRMCEERPKNGTKGIFLHFDNAKPHLVDQELEEMGLIRLQHPPYSPDLAPSDFFLFGYMKFLLEGKEFETPEGLFAEVKNILCSIPKSMLQDAYAEWIDRLKRCIELHGEYVH